MVVTMKSKKHTLSNLVWDLYIGPSGLVFCISDYKASGAGSIPGTVKKYFSIYG